MCVSLLFIEMVGFTAGLTNLVSSVPQLIANLRNPDAAASQCASRNACQFAGNGMWLIYGITIGSFAMSTFSTLGCLMAAALLWQVRTARRAGCADTDLKMAVDN